MRRWERRGGLLVAGSCLVAAIAVGLQPGCSDSMCATCPTERVCPTPIPTPTPEPTPYTGFWHGSGTSLTVVSFTVSDGRSARNAHYFIATPYWPGRPCYISGVGSTGDGPFPITDGFTINVSGSPPTLEGTIVVTFTSALSATATLTVRHANPTDRCYDLTFSDSVPLTKGSL